MNMPSLLLSPVFIVLFKWTCLLALAWVAHWVLRRRDARWRLILWRCILCFGLVLPLLQFVQVPGIKIPIGSDMNSPSELANPALPATAVNPPRPIASMAQPAQAKVARSPTAIIVNFRQHASPPKQMSWASILMVTWAFGFVFGIVRLFRLNLQLSHLKKESSQPKSDLQRLAKQIQIRLNVHQAVDVQTSDAVTSPFVCGLLKPMIILPRMLMHQLSPGEMSALLNHEIAHLRHYDLFGVWLGVG
jgi:beta-lactamase regulating signal transducer with metallopeptidase domain